LIARGRLLVACVTSLALSACAAIWGFQRSEDACSSTDGTGCNPGICFQGACRSPCNADGDCALGSRCVGLQGSQHAGGCVPSDLACDTQTGCPVGTTCAADQACRTSCVPSTGSSLSCLSDQVCVGEVCRGVSAAHDLGTALRDREKWLVVVAPSTDGAQTYITDRDCANPELLCRSCAGVALSPSGRNAVVAIQGITATAKTFAYVDLSNPTSQPITGSVGGATATLIELGQPGANANPTLLFTRDESPCPATSLRRSILGSFGASELTIGAGLMPAVGPIAASASNIALANRTACGATTSQLTIRTLAGFVSAQPALPAGETAAFGAFTDDTAFLAQTMLGTNGTSALYRVTWSGELTAIYAQVEASTSGRLGCAKLRRIGPRGELYCNSKDDGTGDTYRLTTAGAAPVKVACVLEGKPGHVVDVRAP
jgi:hypothetical protein